MLVRGLWGIQIGPQSDQIIKVEASFRITMASISEFNGPERTSVYVRFHDSTFLLCSLIPEKIEQQVVDITCLQGEEITIRVDGPNVIHLLGNYISQNGIDDQNDDEIGFLEVDGSEVDESDDDMQQETASFITFPAERKGLGFDESDEFDSTSESQTESEADSDMASESESESGAVPFYDITRLGSYADRLSSTTRSSETSRDTEDRAPFVLNSEGAGKYVLINGNVSARSSTEETEQFDQQSDILGVAVDQTSLADTQQYTIKTEEQENVSLDSQATTQAIITVESSAEPEAQLQQQQQQQQQHKSDHQVRLDPETASEQVSDYEPEPESEEASELEIEQEVEQVSALEPTLKPVVQATLLPTPEATQQPIQQPSQQITPRPVIRPAPKQDQSTKAKKSVAISEKPKKSKRKPDSIPVNTPSPIKKKVDKATKMKEKKLKGALAKQQQDAKNDGSSRDAKKQKKAQENKEKSKIKAKKMSKKKQALASKNEASSSKDKPTEGGSSQDIQSLVMGAFANMAAALQSAAATSPKPKRTLAPKLKKTKVEQVDQDVTPQVVATSATVKPKKPLKPMAPTTAPVAAQQEQTQSLDASDLGTIPSILLDKKKKPAKKPNAIQDDAIDPPATTPVPIGIPFVSPIPISVPSSARSSPAPGDESPRVRYPRKAVDSGSMQKLALFAKEDAKSADDVRKERKKKKKSQRPDEVVAKKARLSIE